jgi:hypothetical protein
MTPAAVGSKLAVAAQQRDHLCAAFHGARVLVEAGFGEWDGEHVDQDLVAVHAGTSLPVTARGPQVPDGAVSLRDYCFDLPRVDADAAGTSAAGLARAVWRLSGGALAAVPLQGDWSAEIVERLVERAHGLGARLLANIRTGPLWSSRPPVEAVLSYLAGERSFAAPSFGWDVGHFVELVTLVRGLVRALVVVRDSYPSLGWDGHHLQPAEALAAALNRSDGRHGGVLAIISSERADAVRALAEELSLESEFWDNGTQEVAD